MASAPRERSSPRSSRGKLARVSYSPRALSSLVCARNATMSESPGRQKVIEKYLQGLHHEDGYSHGYLKSDNKLLERPLAAVNERYAVPTSRDLNKSPKCKDVLIAS